jgi:hypothetical protein
LLNVGCVPVAFCFDSRMAGDRGVAMHKSLPLFSG